MTKTQSKPIVDDLFAAGAHYGYAKARRHPSARAAIFGTKGKVDIFDLEHTATMLEKAEAFLEKIGREGKNVVFASSKHEIRSAITAAATDAGVQYVAGRWVGGTFSNGALIKKRVDELESLMAKRDDGSLAKYTKKERLMIDREIKRLDEMFGGLRGLRSLPSALVVVDPKHEKNAVAEARMLRIPVVAIASSDCNVADIAYPIAANDSNHTSVSFILSKLAAAYTRGKKDAPAKKESVQPLEARS